jgi:hypothetical protein
MASFQVERRRAFEDAQREADTMFAQYQLSQLSRRATCSGPRVAVLAEIAGASGAALGLWLAEPNNRRSCSSPRSDPSMGGRRRGPIPPARFDGLARLAPGLSPAAGRASRSGRAATSARAGGRTPIGFVASGRALAWLDPGHPYLKVTGARRDVPRRAAAEHARS